jgi:hypothetical protein
MACSCLPSIAPLGRCFKPLLQHIDHILFLLSLLLDPLLLDPLLLDPLLDPLLLDPSC